MSVRSAPPTEPGQWVRPLRSGQTAANRGRQPAGPKLDDERGQRGLIFLFVLFLRAGSKVGRELDELTCMLANRGIQDAVVGAN